MLADAYPHQLEEVWWISDTLQGKARSSEWDDADGMTGTQDVMQGHGSDSQANQGGSLFLISTTTPHSNSTRRATSKTYDRQDTNNILPTQWPQNYGIRNVAYRQVCNLYIGTCGF